MAPEDVGEIYSLSIERVLEWEGTTYSRVYIARGTGVPETAEASIEEHLRAAHVQVTWTDDEDVPSSAVAPGADACVLRLGEIEENKSGVRLPAMMRYSSGDVVGTTLTLEESDAGKWRVTGLSGDVEDSL